MDFIRAFHKIDFDGTLQTVGIDRYGQVWLMNGLANSTVHGRASAQFTPQEAARFGAELITLALEGMQLQRAEAEYQASLENSQDSGPDCSGPPVTAPGRAAPHSPR